MITYKDYSDMGTEFKYITQILEGEIEKGEPNGFNRLIDGEYDYSFVGYSKGSTSAYGTCMHFDKK